MKNSAPGSSHFSLRPATEEDLPLVLNIERSVHLAPWNEAHFLAEMAKPYSGFLALTDDETDKNLIGYIVYWSLLGEYQILNLAVDLQHRGLGWGKLMVRQVMLLAQRSEAQRVILDVRKSNQPAILLYQGLGFAITRIQKGFYSNGEDAYQMTLPLQEQDTIEF